MICKNCGHEIDTNLCRDDGVLQCPSCGAIYRRRASSSANSVLGASIGPADKNSAASAPTTAYAGSIPYRNAQSPAKQEKIRRPAKRILGMPTPVFILVVILVLGGIIASLIIFTNSQKKQNNQAADNNVYDPFIGVWFDSTHATDNVSLRTYVNQDGTYENVFDIIDSNGYRQDRNDGTWRNLGNGSYELSYSVNGVNQTDVVIYNAERDEVFFNGESWGTRVYDNDNIDDDWADSHVEDVSFADMFNSSNDDFDFNYLGNGTVEIVKYNGSETIVSVPESIDGMIVSRIGEEAFYINKQVYRVILPRGITEIGDRAFEFCYSLEEVNLPEALEKIGDYAFDCTNLTSITLPTRVSKIGKSAFGACAFTSVSLPDTVSEVGYNPFRQCKNLTAVSISNTNPTLYVEDGVLFTRGDKRLVCYPYAKMNTSYEIPEGTLSLDEESFEWVQNLQTLIIPKSVKQISTFTFEHCTAQIMVYRDSYAAEYCKDRGIKNYAYLD